MAPPRFHFVDTSPPAADDQFWRDVDASDRLGSRFKANLYLRELCRAKAWAHAGPVGTADHFAREASERRLLREVSSRGYRLFGPDLASVPETTLARVG